jgi:hypothetical protein
MLPTMDGFSRLLCLKREDRQDLHGSAIGAILVLVLCAIAPAALSIGAAKRVFSVEALECVYLLSVNASGRLKRPD